MSWKPEVKVIGEPDKWYDNALRFATRAEAEANAKDLHRRWTQCTDWRATESADPVNATWDGELKMLDTPKPTIGGRHVI